jgi:phenylacetate-coenzyme A ligase PaaK-like adenylate-forming protein
MADALPPQLFTHTTIIETGGMKGRGAELTRTQLHQILSTAFGCDNIHSEYGMTELLSQAYAKQDGKFTCPPWMKILIQDPSDPKQYLPHGKTGRICVIDLANINSCSFIATDDLGKTYPDGTFEVLGRLDFSDLRGCNQLIQ